MLFSGNGKGLCKRTALKDTLTHRGGKGLILLELADKNRQRG